MASTAELGAPLFIDVEGLRIRYVRSPGDDMKTPVLLVSPFPESLYAYDDIWADLSQAAPLVGLDLAGFGQSESRPELMNSQAMGTFVTKVLAALGLRRVHAIGPDVGTSALLFAASQRPEMFESLVVGSGGTDVARTGSLKDIIFADSTASFEAIDGADYAATVLEKRAHSKPTPFVLNDYRESYAGRRLVEALAYIRAYATYLPLLQTQLPGIATPVLSIWGAHDPIVLPESAEILDQALPHTRSVVLDSGHFVWHDHAQEYAQIVLDWINDGYQTV
ncbi:MAG TPA: alpha/beta hydrolase [Mycobacterium sp.]|nr:alpha/beta hydrolase [Mycobacterium sp.]